MLICIRILKYVKKVNHCFSKYVFLWPLPKKMHVCIVKLKEVGMVLLLTV